jgi:hypothetical protein
MFRQGHRDGCHFIGSIEAKRASGGTLVPPAMFIAQKKG